MRDLWSSGGSEQPTRERRLEIESVLAARGLHRGPRRFLSSARQPLDSAGVVAELLPALRELGPVFVAFGRYLSSRADFLPAADCLTLEELRDSAPARSLAAVDDQLAEELGRGRSEVFPAFDETPFETRWLWQAHRARLVSGERVVVKVLTPDLELGLATGFEDELATELEALASLKAVFSDPSFSSPEHFEGVLADFRQSLSSRRDLRIEASALRSLGRDARNNELLVVPEVFRQASSARVMTVQWLPGTTLGELAGQPMQEVDAFDLARRIALIWQQLALVGRQLPVEADLIELPDGRLAVIGGLFATLPETSRVNLWNYLRATVGHFPDRASACLLREVEPLAGASAAELQTRVRQAVPFRDGGWSASGETLGEYAVAHWRLLRGVGFRARGHLDAFYQGFFWAARRARCFAPRADPLGEALRDLDWLAGWNQFRELASPRQLGRTAESALSSLVELPQKLDRILSVASNEGFRASVAPAPRRKSRNQTTLVFALALVMAAIVLLADAWRILAAEVGLAEGWSEGLLAVTFVAVGYLWLKNVWGRRRD